MEATKPTPEELAVIFDRHAKWRRGEEGGTRADLADANLAGANLADADANQGDNVKALEAHKRALAAARILA